MNEYDLLNYNGYAVDGVMRIKDKYGFRVKLKYADGKEVVKQHSGFGKKEAKAKREETIVALEKGEYVLYPRVKVREFLQYWFDNVIMSKTDSNNTYMTYRNIIYNYIIPKFGNQRACCVDGRDLEKFLRNVEQDSESIAGLCKTVLNTSFDFAASKKIVAKNPMKSLDIRIGSSEEKRYDQRVIDTKCVLNEEQLKILLDSAKGTPMYIFILFAALMGLRSSEIVGIKYSDVNFNDKTLRLKRQLGKIAGTQKEEFKPKMLTKQERKPKTASGVRTIRIPDMVYDEILRLKVQYERHRSRRRSVFQDLDYICCSTYGRPRGRGYAFKPYKKLLKECGLPDVRFHDLRHSNSTLLIKNDASPKAVAKALGQANERITLDVYTDKDAIILDEVDALESFIAEVIPKEIEITDNSDYEIDVSEYV